MDFTTIHAAVDYIRGYGIFAPAAAFVLFFVQAIFPVFPYFILAGAAGLVFGFWEGFLLSWSGALSGACLAFLVIRLTEWDWLRQRLRTVFKRDIAEVTPFMGFWGIVLARIFPVVPTPLINFVSGISSIPFRVFLVASALGKIPTALLYTGLGNHMLVTEDINGTLLLLGGVIMAGYAGMRLVRRRFGRQ